MRFSPVALTLALAASTMTANLAAQTVDPASEALVAKGEQALKAGDLVAADNALEAALVLDPKNEDAFTGMARVSIAQELYGQAVAMTRKALVIDPTDRQALLVQGEALAAMGATERARVNLARLDELCGADCAERQNLAMLIERGPVMASRKKDEAEAAN